MSEDFISFQDELLTTSREAIEFSKLYLQARKNNSHAFNQLQVLINKAGLQKTKKSIENKILELMADENYGEQAIKLNIEMSESESEYKSYELIVKAYLAHCSALQSVLKVQQSGELTEAMKNRYNRSPSEI